jgi:hypothetical protein
MRHLWVPWDTAQTGRATLRAGSFGLLMACTAFEPGTDELLPEELTQSLEPGRDWTCLRDEAAPPPPYLSNPASARRVVQSVQFLNIVTGQAIPGISVRACSQRDVECDEQITAALPVGADGWIDMPLFEGFSGYLEITGESVVPTVLFYPNPITGVDVYATPVALVERSVLPALTRELGSPQSGESGLVVLRALDCQGEDALGIQYSIDKSGSPWYFVGGLPTLRVSETAESGIGGFTNVEPGIAVVRATLASSARQVAEPTTVLVRPGWMTALRFVPEAP